MTIEEYLDALLTLPNIDDDLIPKVSPDGKWVAWTWFRMGPTADVFAAPTDGSVAPIRLEVFRAVPGYQDVIDYARRHLQMIERFGRFPHRNAILGRASTAEEREFLQGPGSSF